MPGVIFLDVDAQTRLGYTIANQIPYNSYARKMIGYLYAIQVSPNLSYLISSHAC